jgi:hypothetical protein
LSFPPWLIYFKLAFPLFNRRVMRAAYGAIIPLSFAVAKPMPGGKLPHNGACHGTWPPVRLATAGIFIDPADRVSRGASPAAPDKRN